MENTFHIAGDLFPNLLTLLVQVWNTSLLILLFYIIYMVFFRSQRRK